MKTFKELIEAKIEANLLKTVPAAEGERKFVERHTVKDILAAFRANSDNSPFDGTKAKIYPRKPNRFGNDTIQSIKAYESENLDEGKMLKPKPRHIIIGGKYVGSTDWEPNNKKAIKRWLEIHPNEKGRTKIKVATESLSEKVTKFVNKDLEKKN